MDKYSDDLETKIQELTTRIVRGDADDTAGSRLMELYERLGPNRAEQLQQRMMRELGVGRVDVVWPGGETTTTRLLDS